MELLELSVERISLSSRWLRLVSHIGSVSALFVDGLMAASNRCWCLRGQHRRSFLG
jgi:hypothetical protein